VHALQVLTEMLGGCAESRLQSRLVRQSRDATSVEVIYDPESLDLQVVSIIARLRPDWKMHDLSASVHAELRAIAAGEFHEAELKHVKRDLTAKMTIGVDGMPPAARLVGEALVHGRTLNEVREWRRRIEEVGINEVRQAAKALSSAPSVTGLLTDKASALPIEYT
jgi:zinc protease